VYNNLKAERKIRSDFPTFTKIKMDRKITLQKYYLKNREKVLARNKKWNKEHRKEMTERAKKWAENNPEKIKESLKKYNDNYPERRKLQYRKYRETHREKVRKTQRDYFRKNPSAQHRNKIKNAEGEFTAKEWERLKKRYGYKCLRCGIDEIELLNKTGIGLTVDHIQPLSKNGTNYIDNIQPLCKSCNVWKFTKYIDYR